MTYILGPIKFQILKEYFIFALSELLNKGIFVGPNCEKSALDVAALQSEDLKTLEREHLTVGLVLELWKKKDSIKQMQRWITALTPMELQKYLSGVTSQNLNKTSNGLLKKKACPSLPLSSTETVFLKRPHTFHKVLTTRASLAY